MGQERIVSSPQNHQSGNHHPQVGGANGKKSHDNSKGSSKGSRKSQVHSTNAQNQSKPNMGRSRHGQGQTCSPNGMNKANLALQHQQAPFPLMKQHPMTGRQLKGAATPRQKSYTPPTLHPMPSGQSKRTGSPVVQSGSNQQQKDKEHFYAGARFETHPSHIGLPVPPSHWTAEIQRSQSQPSSPVPISMPQKGVSVDLATLFGHSAKESTKSASFPGERLMSALMKMEEDRKKKEEGKNSNNGTAATVNFGSPNVNKAQVTYASPNEVKPVVGTEELKKALGLAIFASPVKLATPLARLNSTPSHFGSEMSPSKHQDISVQLKNLLKVAA